MSVLIKQPILSKIPISFHLDDVGDGTGSREGNGDYSITPKTKFIQPPVNEIYMIHELSISVVGITAFGVSEYGNIGAALTNGITIKITIDGVVTNFTQHPIKTNSDLMEVSTYFVLHPFKNQETALTSKINADSFDANVILKGYSNDKLEIILNDDFRTLDQHEFLVRGYK